MALPAWLAPRSVSLAAAATGTYVLNVVIQNPQQTAWAAQAVAASISTFYKGTSGAKSQCQIAGGVAVTNCCTALPAACLNSVTLTDCVTAAGNYLNGTSGPPAPVAVTNAIAANQPVGVKIAWTGGGYGFCTIYGYTIPGQNAWIWYIADPVNGYSLMNSTIFPSGYFAGGTWSFITWTQA